MDMDQDGFDDIFTIASFQLKIYLGGSPHIDTVAAYSLSPQGSSLFYPSAGDMNGDGYIDIAFTDYVGTGDYDINILEGGSDGWKSSRNHMIDMDTYSRSKIADVDKDGYGDLITHSFTSPSYTLRIWKGGISFPTSASITKTASYGYNIAVAIPEGEGGGPKAYRGTFTSVPITLPDTLTQKWDVAYLEGAFPANTSARITVLDGNSGSPITGYKDLAAMDVDLSGVTTNSIKLEVTILTELNTTTPSLDALTVKWMDRREWRDEFFGPGKVDRLLNIDVAGGTMQAGDIGGQGPQLIFPSLLGEANYTTSPLAFYDAGGADYLTRDPFDFKVKGTTAADIADVNGDG
ncbi:MAG: hypothetical protein GWN39_13585, partial [Thermoplasmata archaeon]|nr:VCBS repeat-containing protein [Thermoplasmata archaeon]NIS13092.1 VCBS repeat-containing protein [Thermoplasmata archaeon]NIV79739.1 hypothetical protein [Thermoplasmata archaeon]NIW89807.1 hypothetical protein [Thermoplasmata archaeon]